MLPVERLSIPDVLIVRPDRYPDARGYFSETYSRARFAEIGIDVEFVQDNQSFSAERGVLRGLHFQAPPHAQGKLVRVVAGRIFDVAVDLRSGSPTFGRHVAAEISAGDGRQIWVPAGFAHGFVTLAPATEVLYKVTSPYAPAAEMGIAWDDPALAIDWPVEPGAVILSDKDSRLPRLGGLGDIFPKGSV
ncbi:MAG: dTDP-4-dehydrorhamnose 3,5-epimerase [Hyphomicrobiales bacterium]